MLYYMNCSYFYLYPIPTPVLSLTPSSKSSWAREMDCIVVRALPLHVANPNSIPLYNIGFPNPTKCDP